MNKRLLVVTPWKRRWELGDGAGLADDYYFIHELTRHGWELHYLSPRYAGSDVSASGYFVHAFPDVLGATEHWPTALRRPLWPLLFTAFAVYYGLRAVRRVEPSVVLGQTYITAWAVRVLARVGHAASAVKLFGVVELDRTDWSRWRYLRKNIEQILAFQVRVDRWLILDDGSGGTEAARRHGVAPGRIRTLPNGVNVEWSEYRRDPAAIARVGIPAGVPVVLFLARLTAWKRPDSFLRAVPRVLQLCRRPVLFVVGGGGGMQRRCEDLAAELGVSDVVRFLGPVAHSDVPVLMSTVTVFASTNERSNRAIPTCEAMSCGVPVVAFDVGDTRAVVRDGETGRLVPDGDLDALANAIAALLNHDAEREAMGRRAKEFARATFTGWPERIGMERRIFEELIDDGER